MLKTKGPAATGWGEPLSGGQTEKALTRAENENIEISDSRHKNKKPMEEFNLTRDTTGNGVGESGGGDWRYPPINPVKASACWRDEKLGVLIRGGSEKDWS